VGILIRVGTLTLFHLVLSSNEWIWIGGDNTGNEPGIYGAKGTPAPANFPGSREAATASLDSSGNVWLFGGIAYDSLGQFAADMNDLWQFNPSTNAWTWVTGSNLNMLSGPLPGVYGDRGVASAANTPGARDGAISWADRGGNLWLFGGYGYDAAGDFGALNDLWQFNTSTTQWTWISGSNATFDPGVYGTQGIAAAGNVPPARQRCLNWIDSNGNLWLFGGIGWNPSEAGMLNDLWKFDPTTDLWTWVSGSPGLDAAGVYGTEGQAASSNVPGGRETATGWIDQNNNLWVYGGIMNGGNGYSDLWQFNPSTNMWTWESGSQTADLAGVYGTEGTPAPANFPGTRSYSLGWTDSSGNLWLFGGSQQDTQGQGNLNDLWRYVP
jgi:N-acetylneuraminic acid mutarotase